MIRRSSFEEVLRVWMEADKAKPGPAKTLGILVPFRDPAQVPEWLLVELETADTQWVHAIHSNRAAGQINAWEVLSGGSYRFDAIAASVLGRPGAEPCLVRQMLDFAAREVTWDLPVVGVTRSTPPAQATVFCLDGCHRLAAHAVRLARSQTVRPPQILLGVGPRVEEGLRESLGFDLR